MKDPLETTESVLLGFAEKETKEELSLQYGATTPIFLGMDPGEADDPDDPASEFPDPPIVDVDDEAPDDKDDTNTDFDYDEEFEDEDEDDD